MGRPPRIQFEGAQYHIFPRGNRRERIAHRDQDYRIMEQYFIETAQRADVKPRAWFPMPNHFHGLLETPLGNLSAFMQAWLSRYARYYNRVYKKIGHLFQGRFGSRLVQNDRYQKELIRYIHLQKHRSRNPAALDPFCMRYSSHRFYQGETCPPLIREWVDPMLELFGTTQDQARKNYARYLADGLRDATWQDFYKPTHNILGDETFIKKIQSKMNQSESQLKIHLPVWRCQQIGSQLFQNAATLFDVHESQLCSANQRRDWSRVRKAVACCGFKLGLSIVALARLLKRSPSTISEMLSQSHVTEEIKLMLDRIKN